MIASRFPAYLVGQPLESDDRLDELVMSLCTEAGKPIGDSEGEVHRLIDTFKIASEESVRIGGEVAIAVGCPFVLKPASRTPIGALMEATLLENVPED